jgi:hypothetical protein
MYQRAIIIDNEIEWLNIQAFLNKEEIPYSFRKLQDSAFPSFDMMHQPIEVIIPDEFSFQFFKFVDKDYPSTILNIRKTSQKSYWNLLSFSLLVYGIAMTALFFKFYHIYQHHLGDKNFNYVWNWDNNELSLKHKRSHKTIGIRYDKNYDFNFEKSVEFLDDIKVLEAIDEDENGFIEKTYSYAVNGEFEGSNMDTDKDKLIDYILFILEDGDSLVLTDKNKDGFFQIEKPSSN